MSGLIVMSFSSFADIKKNPDGWSGLSLNTAGFNLTHFLLQEFHRKIH